MSPQKHATTSRDADGSQDNRKQPKISKARGQRILSDNASERECAQRTDNVNVDQQADRANVRQNTTRQGNRRASWDAISLKPISIAEGVMR